MRKMLLGAVSALALGVSGAVADDHLPFDDGLYIGANAGLAFLDGDADIFVGGVATDFDLSDTGFTVGGQIGYNMQYDQWMLGVEGDFNYLDVDDNGTAPGATSGAFALDSDWFATIRARGGVVVDQTLFYGTGGIAFMDAEPQSDPDCRGCSRRAGERQRSAGRLCHRRRHRAQVR